VIEAIALAYWQETVIKVLVILMIIPAGALILGYTFLMKMMSHMQSRLGPMEAGPHGVLQLVADGVKFLQKEDLTPRLADKKVFALAVSSISVIGVLMAGWASANKYSLLGALRAAGQLIAYELPLVLAVIGVVVQAETMNLQGIVHAQVNGEIFGWGGIGLPFILTQPLGFALFLVAAQAELTQTPFDMPVAESELVAGYMTEYSGFRFLFFFMGEFGTAFALSAIAATLFLGGWYVPGIGASNDWYYLIGPAVLFAKIMLVSFFIFWFRFTYPRFREDQLQALAWKFLIPLALINILVTGILKVAL
jgi:NADH-quinone oxidoreductase subunit H